MCIQEGFWFPEWLLAPKQGARMPAVSDWNPMDTELRSPEAIEPEFFNGGPSRMTTRSFFTFVHNSYEYINTVRSGPAP